MTLCTPHIRYQERDHDYRNFPPHQPQPRPANRAARFHVQPRRNSGDVIVEADAVANDDAPSMSVSYAGLDLNDPAGMRIFYGRLKVAARLVCGGDISEVRKVQRIFAHKTCVNDALDSAIDSTGNAALTTLHQESAARAPVAHLSTPEAAGDREVEHEERRPFMRHRLHPPALCVCKKESECNRSRRCRRFKPVEIVAADCTCYPSLCFLCTQGDGSCSSHPDLSESRVLP